MAKVRKITQLLLASRQENDSFYAKIVKSRMIQLFFRYFCKSK